MASSETGICLNLGLGSSRSFARSSKVEKCSGSEGLESGKYLPTSVLGNRALSVSCRTYGCDTQKHGPET